MKITTLRELHTLPSGTQLIAKDGNRFTLNRDFDCTDDDCTCSLRQRQGHALWAENALLFNGPLVVVEDEE